jgi:hypothetical protein
MEENTSSCIRNQILVEAHLLSTVTRNSFQRQQALSSFNFGLKIFHKGLVVCSIFLPTSEYCVDYQSTTLLRWHVNLINVCFALQTLHQQRQLL